MKEEIIKKYYDNGQLQCETPYLNGKKHGLLKWWYYNGQLRYEVTRKNNLQCGAKIEFIY